MHIALQVTGYGALLFIVLTWLAYKATERAGDNFGAAIFSLGAGAVAIILAVAWLTLIIIKAANA
jgi:hypothetical protein